MTVSIAAIDEELDKIFALIAAVHRFIEGDRLVDLAAMHSRIDHVCAAISTLPKGKVQPLAAKLENLLAELDRLSAGLNERFGELPIMPSHSANTATAAYADMLKHFP